MAATVRIAEASASTAASLATVRIAEIIAIPGSASAATVRIADVQAYAIQGGGLWDGTEWVPIGPPGTGLSVGKGTSVGSSGATTSTGTGASVGSGKSTGSGTTAISGELDLAGGGTLTLSGGKSTPGNNSGSLIESGTGTLALSGAALVGPPGLGSVTVMAEPDNSPPRILLQLAGFLGTTCQIWRNDPSGRNPVRTGNPADLTGGGALLYDYEAPYNVTVTYTVIATKTVVSDPVTLTATRPWLVHPGIPDLSQPIMVANVGDRTQDTNQGVHRPLGRRNAIVITDGQRQSPTFDLAIGIETADQELALETLLDDSSPLLLQIVYPNTRRTMYKWVAVGSVTEADAVPYFASEYQTWTLPCTVTDMPSGLLQSQRTWADVLAEFDTWQDVIDTYATWRDVITDNRRN